MKIFTKTFLYTLALLVLIAGLANGIIYTLMPTVYTKQKQQNLTAQADQLAQRLGSAKREDIARLMGSFSARTGKYCRHAGRRKVCPDRLERRLRVGGSVTTSVTVTSGTASSGTNSVSTKTGTEKDTGNTGSVAVDGSAALEPGGFYSPAKTIKAQRSFTMEGESGTLVVSATLAPVEEAVGVIVSLLPISILLCVVIAVVFSLLYARAITRPIRAISHETRHMTLLERDARCEIKSKDEFGELAANVNGLYENLLCTIDNLEAELKRSPRRNRRNRFSAGRFPRAEDSGYRDERHHG